MPQDAIFVGERRVSCVTQEGAAERVLSMMIAAKNHLLFQERRQPVLDGEETTLSAEQRADSFGAEALAEDAGRGEDPPPFVTEAIESRLHHPENRVG